MIPTYFGVLVLIIGAWLMRRNDPLILLCWMMGFGLFSASAALVLTALGSSSIPPARMFLGFVLLSVILHIRNRATLLNEAIVAHTPLIIFCIYGFISALILPRIFAYQIDIVPMRPPVLRHLRDVFPLVPTPQNVTTAFYMLGTGLTAIAAYVAGRLADDVTPIAKACGIITLIHAVTGVLGVALAGTPWDAFVDFIRNGSYAQLRQETDGFIRVAGLTPEPSTYANFGIIWWIFSFELWLRNIQPRLTGIAALAMTAVLMISTSSTAYVAMAAYGGIVAIRLLRFPPYLKANKIFTIGLMMMLAGALVAAVLLLVDGLAQQVMDMVEGMLLNKAESESGQQRAFWAMQGLDAFLVSSGLGIGAGSFRSSSLAMAILGSMGVIGTVMFAWSCASLFRSPYMPATIPGAATRKAVAESAAWAAVAGLLPAMINQASPDPGMEYAALAGLALALRRPSLALTAARRSGFSGWTSAPPPAPPALPPKEPEAPPPGGWRHSSR